MNRLLNILLLTSVAFAQAQGQVPPQGILVIDKLLGLNTKSGLFSLKPNELTVAHNIDYTQVGAYQRRKGYDSISAFTGMDSIVHNGIFPAFYSDGTQQLVVVTDSSGVGYGGVYLSPLGSADLSSATRIWDYWSVQTRPFFEQYRDNVYISNGSHRPIVYNYNSKLAREVPLRRPGEPRIVPLTTTGPIHGEIVYRISSNGGGFGLLGGHSDGIISDKIKISNGQVLVKDFSYPIRDSLDNPFKIHFLAQVITAQNNTDYYVKVNDDSCGYTSDADATVEEIAAGLTASVNSNAGDTVDATQMSDGGVYDNSVWILSDDEFASYICSTGMSQGVLQLNGDSTWALFVHRTKANPGVIDRSDSVILIKTVNVYYNDTTLLETLTIIDSTSDAGAYASVLYNPNFFGRDSLGVLTYRYGAPRYLSGADSVADSAAYGVYGGWPDSQHHVVGVAYACTFVDTITGIESDTSRTLVIFKDSGAASDSIMWYQIALPRLPAGQTGLKINLYRGMLFVLGNDSTWVYDSLPGIEFCILLPSLPAARLCRESKLLWTHSFSIDSTYIEQLHRVAILPGTTTVFVDSTRYDSLTEAGVALRPSYSQVEAPPLMSGMFTFQNRMFAVHRNRLYYSDLDFDIGGASINDWSSWKFISVEEGDGDVIVLAYPTRDYIRVYKHDASYIVHHTETGFQLQTDYDGIWPNIDYLGAYGCISAPSFADAPEGNYYLSEQGVFLETEGVYRTKQREIAFVSKQLDNFDKLSISDKGNSYAAYLPSEQKYLLSINDTSYVWDNRAQAWSTWNLTFSGSALYRAENEVKNYPGDTLYFIRPGEATLYRYGTSETDNGVDIQSTWKFAPWFVDHNEYTITDIGVWVSSNDTSANDLALIGYNEKGDSVFGEFLPALNENRYIKKSISPSGALYYQLSVETAAGAGLDSTVIDRFDIYYMNQGTVESK